MLGHHEKWDGTGYPRQLAGVAIPVSARLMALADVYDALISRRVYKPAMTHEQAAATAKIERGDLQPGDLVFFNTLKRTFSHVGIYVGNNKFIHSPRPGAQVRVMMAGIEVLHRALTAKRYGYMRPGLERMPWGTLEVGVTDPFGNRIRFCEPVES